MRRPHVLLKPNNETAALLRSQPGRWFVIATGDLEDWRTLVSTASRIRNGTMKDFPDNAEGRYEVRATSEKGRPDAIAPCEVYGQFVPTGSGPAPAAE